MKKRILLPTSFFSSLLFTIFLFGFMIGLFFLPIILDYGSKSNSEPKTIPNGEYSIVKVVQVADGDTIYIKVNNELDNKLDKSFKDYLTTYIAQVQDENTIVIENNKPNESFYNDDTIIKVRLLGIDAPESHDDSQKNFYSFEATDFVEKKINNKDIKIEWDNNRKSKATRLWAYVYTQDEKGNYNKKSLNELMLEEGYAEVLRRDKNPSPHSKQEEFRNLENQARRKHKGIWNYQENVKWQDKQDK